MTDEHLSDEDRRAILREHGHTPPAKGKLSGHWRDLVDDIRTGAEPGSPEPGESYDAGVTAADFPDPAPEPDGAVEGTPVIPAERRPRRVKPQRPTLTGRLKGARGKAAARKPKRPRVPVDRIVSRFWDVLGGLAGRVDPPLGRCLQMQAPVAGLILEDVVKGTMVDRALQPLARAEEKGEKVLALAGPPMLVLALEKAQGLPPQERAMREAVLLPMLEESLHLWTKIAGDKVAEKARRDAEDGPAREQVAELLAMIWPEPEPEPAKVAA